MQAWLGRGSPSALPSSAIAPWTMFTGEGPVSSSLIPPSTGSSGAGAAAWSSWDIDLVSLLSIAILALAGARRAVLGQEPKACHEVSAPLAHGLTRY